MFAVEHDHVSILSQQKNKSPKNSGELREIGLNKIHLCLTVDNKRNHIKIMDDIGTTGPPADSFSLESAID